MAEEREIRSCDGAKGKVNVRRKNKREMLENGKEYE